MAWQTPKTNWSSADGVRTDDLNRIEGNILELYKVSAQMNDITIYVSTSGNDTSGTGASASPFASINKALSVLPKNLNGKAVTINIAAGTYNEAVHVNSFCGGSITLTGAINAAVTVSNLTITSSIVLLTNIKLTTGSCTVINNATLISTTAVLMCSGGGLNVTNCSTAHVVELIVNNAYTALQAINASTLNISTVSGSGNTQGMYVSGSELTYGTSTLIASTPTYTTNGGRILTGSGTSGGGGGLPAASVE